MHFSHERAAWLQVEMLQALEDSLQSRRSGCVLAAWMLALEELLTLSAFAQADGQSLLAWALSIKHLLD